jgi:hypothetical protein
MSIYADLVPLYIGTYLTCFQILDMRGGAKNCNV